MNDFSVADYLSQATIQISNLIAQPDTYSELAIIAAVYIVAFFITAQTRNHIQLLKEPASQANLFPLNGRRRLAGDVVSNPRDAIYLIDDPA